MKDSHILIVDDDPMTCVLLASWAEHRGARTVTAESTAAADAALARASFDILLSDVHLPGNHQLDWVQSVLGRTNAPAVVLITASPGLPSTLRAANLAVSSYMVKPLNLDCLRDRCTELLANRRQRHELLELSRETARLLSSPGNVGALDPSVRNHLAGLCANLVTASGHDPRRATAADAPWRDMITEVIIVLEKTKPAFRSKDLGRLRRRLEETLHSCRA